MAGLLVEHGPCFSPWNNRKDFFFLISEHQYPEQLTEFCFALLLLNICLITLLPTLPVVVVMAGSKAFLAVGVLAYLVVLSTSLLLL